MSYAIVIASMATLLGCSPATGPQSGNVPRQQGPVTVYVVNYPLQYFAERIGGQHVEIHFPAPPDEDPAHWMPNAETIAGYQAADLILLNGAGYAAWIDKVSLPKIKFVDTSIAFADQLILAEQTVTHRHGPEGEHVHGTTASTTWLDPQLGILQSDAIRAAFTKLLPGHEQEFENNFAALRTDLEEVDRQITEIVAEMPDRAVVFSHPVYQYLIRRYELNARSLHWEPAEFPSERMWDDFDQLLAEHPATSVIWEAIPIARTKQRIAEQGLRSVVFGTCGNRPKQGDFLSVQRDNVEAMTTVFAKAADGADN